MKGTLRMMVGVVSLLLLLAWTGMFLFVVGMSGFGARRTDSFTMLCLVAPFPYLSFYVLSSRGLLEGRTLTRVAIVAHVLIVPFVGACFLNGLPGAIVGAGVIAFSALWYALNRGRLSGAEAQLNGRRAFARLLHRVAFRS